MREEQRARREMEDKEKKRKAEVETRRRELEEKKTLEARKRLEEKRRKAEEQREKAEEQIRKKEEEAKRKDEEEKREKERLRLEEERALEEEKRQKVRDRDRFLYPLFWPLPLAPFSKNELLIMVGVVFSGHDFSRLPFDDAPGALSFSGGFRWEQEAEEERARREFEAQIEAVSQLDMLHKEEQSR